MDLEKELSKRSHSKCELCGNSASLFGYEVPKAPSSGVDANIHICNTCHEQINDQDKIDANHWRCLNDSMWSEVEAVKVMSWRMLNRLKNEDWTQDLLDMFYLDNETLKWAQATGEEQDDDIVKHKDSNGNILENGDHVVLIKTLDVKGSSLTAKRGTVVRKISLVEDNPEQIEGRVEGQQIVILTKFVKKSN
jgi:protein PhnA